jgi:CHAD domain-containing protein
VTSDVARIGPARIQPAPLSPPPVPDPPRRLDPGATELDAVRAALTGPTNRLLGEEPGVRLGKDPEAIHDARVSVRRLRSHLRTFRPILDPEWSRRLRRELAWLGDAIGEVRDAEVLRDRLWSRLEDEDAEGSGAALIVALESSRMAARRRLLEAMASARYRSLLEGLVSAAREPVGLAGREVGPAADALPLMAKPWKKLRKRVASAGSDPTDEALHRIRIDTKRVRYAAEAFVPIVGKRADRFASVASSLQSVLGEHQDAVTTMEWLRQHAEHADDPLVAFTAGRLAEVDARARAEARASWPKAWRKLEGRKRFWR